MNFKNIFVDYVIKSVNTFLTNNNCLSIEEENRNYEIGKMLKTDSMSYEDVGKQIEDFVNNAIKEIANHNNTTIDEANDEFIELYFNRNIKPNHR